MNHSKSTTTTNNPTVVIHGTDGSRLTVALAKADDTVEQLNATWSGITHWYGDDPAKNTEKDT